MRERTCKRGRTDTPVSNKKLFPSECSRGVRGEGNTPGRIPGTASLRDGRRQFRIWDCFCTLHPGRVSSGSRPRQIPKGLPGPNPGHFVDPFTSEPRRAGERPPPEGGPPVVRGSCVRRFFTLSPETVRARPHKPVLMCKAVASDAGLRRPRQTSGYDCPERGDPCAVVTGRCRRRRELEPVSQNRTRSRTPGPRSRTRVGTRRDSGEGPDLRVAAVRAPVGRTRRVSSSPTSKVSRWALT